MASATAQETAMLTHEICSETSAGKIDPNWLAGARQNEGPDNSVEEWFCRAGNWTTVGIDDDGEVFVQGACDGAWLSQDAIDDACRTIDAGV